MAYAGSCKDCKHCDGDVMQSSSRCRVVFDPVRGTKMPITHARMDTWNGYTLPCGYAGALWEGKS